MRDDTRDKDDRLVQEMTGLSKLVRKNNFDLLILIADPTDKIFIGENSKFRGLLLMHGASK